MRIKTAPRHRIPQDNNEIASATKDEDADKANDTSAIQDYSINKRDNEDVYLTCASSSTIFMPSSTTSSNELTLTSSTDTLPSLADYDNNNVEVLNLSTKDALSQIDKTAADTSSEPEDKLKDSFLYKIMTDPNFLESIQRNRQLQKKFVCLFCKKEFVTYAELTSHMEAKRDDSNQIACCACKKTFSEKRYLKYHRRCHSERTKFTCDICTRKYTRMDNLTRHNVLHVNPDKFSCTICNRTFTRKDLLNKHRKSHEKCNLYCVKCGKYFRSILTLENHQKTHRDVSNASVNTCFSKIESSVSAESTACKIENSVPADDAARKPEDVTSVEMSVCKSENIVGESTNLLSDSY